MARRTPREHRQLALKQLVLARKNLLESDLDFKTFKQPLGRILSALDFTFTTTVPHNAFCHQLEEDFNSLIAALDQLADKELTREEEESQGWRTDEEAL